VVGVDRIHCHVASTSALRYRSVPTNLTSLLFNCFQYLPPSLPAHVAILPPSRHEHSHSQPEQSLPSSLLPSPVLLHLPSSELHRLDSLRLHLSIEHSTQPPVTLVARHLATTSLNSLHLRHSAPTFPPVWTNALPHVATSPMHPHSSTTPFFIPPSHFPTHSTAPTYTSTQSSDTSRFFCTLSLVAPARDHLFVTSLQIVH
jgi:hypothetical protein